MSLRRDTPKSRAFADKRSELKRSVWLPPRTRLRQRSTKQAKKDRELAAVRVIVLERDEHTCQLRSRVDGHHCSGGLHVHHRRLRSQGGTHDPSNLLTLCDGAHSWVHANPAEAALFGLIELRPDATDTPHLDEYYDNEDYWAAGSYDD